MGVSRRQEDTELRAVIAALQHEAATRAAGASNDTAINRLEQLVHAQPCAVLFADNTGRYTGANAAATRLTGFSRGELLGSSVFDITGAEDEHDVEVLWRAFLRTRHQGGDIVVRRRDGSRITARYMAVTNLLPGIHVSVLALAN